MLEYLLSACLGLFLGIAFGIIPGLHLNLLVPIFITFSSNPLLTAIIIITSTISFNFFEFIRTTFLSIPTESTVLGLYPSHKMVLKGKGLLAVKLFASGCLMSIIFLSILFPLFIFIIPKIYYNIKPLIPFILMFLSIYFILLEDDWKKWIIASFAFIGAGLLGVMTIQLELTNPFLPLLSGLFGLSIIVGALGSKKQKIPKQSDPKKLGISKIKMMKAALISSFSAILLSLIPSLSPSQATLASQGFYKKSQKEFLVSIGGISTADVLFSLFALYTISKARSGTIEVIKSVFTVTQTHLVLFIGLALITGIVSYLLVIFIAKRVNIIIETIGRWWIYLVILGLIVALTFMFDTWKGLIILFLSTSLGYLVMRKDIRKVHLLGCLNLVTILFFLRIL